MQKTNTSVRLSAATLILLISVTIGGGILSFLGATTADEAYRKTLADRAATIATTLDAEKVIKLTSSTATNSPDYTELKTKLNLLKQSNADARTVYLAGVKSSGIYAIVDSELPGSAYFVAPGQAYNNASKFSEGLFNSSTAFVEGPTRDDYGSLLSGLAPVIDLRTGKTVAVVGIDIDAAGYKEAVTSAAAIPLLAALVFLVVLIIYELNRQRQQRELRTRSELISIASHELRTPITGMRWAAESLLGTTPDGPAKAMVSAMYDSIMNLQTGTEDILQLTRIASNRDQKLKLESVNLSNLLNEVCNTQRLAAQQKKVSVVMDGSWTPDLMVTCDPTKIRRALHNIVDNAVKYTRQGTSVTIHYERTAKQHRIMVTDQGIGIPKDEQSRVLGGFYRASNAKATGESGTGLGLYLTKVIMNQHKGDITFTSNEGQGTTFVLTLPIVKPPKKLESAPVNPPQSTTPQATNKVDTKIVNNVK